MNGKHLPDPTPPTGEGAAEDLRKLDQSAAAAVSIAVEIAKLADKLGECVHKAFTRIEDLSNNTAIKEWAIKGWCSKAHISLKQAYEVRAQYLVTQPIVPTPLGMVK